MIVEADKKLRAAQIGSINGIQYLRSFREGDLICDGYTFCQGTVFKGPVRSLPVRSPVKDLRAIEDRLIFKMNALYNLRQQLTPDLELFWKQQKEIDELQKTLMGHPANGQGDHYRLVTGSSTPGGRAVLIRQN